MTVNPQKKEVTQILGHVSSTTPEKGKTKGLKRKVWVGR